MKHVYTAFGLGLILLLAACGGGTPAPKIAVSPKTITLAAGSAAQNFSAALSNISGSPTINWAISPSIGSLSATTGATVFYTPPASVGSPTTVTLTATSGTLSDSATITVNPPPTVTISGTVLDTSDAPVPGANVLLNGANLKTTGADGTFSYTGVTPPYTLTVRIGTSVLEYRGLTRTTLKLGGKMVYSASSGGMVTGPSYPLPAGEAILVSGTNGVFTAAPLVASATTGNYSGTLGWFGSASKVSDLVALKLKISGSTITAYQLLGKRVGVSLNDGVGQTGLDIALGVDPVPTIDTTFSYGGGAYSTGLTGGIAALKAGGATFSFGFGGLPVASGSLVKLPGEGGAVLVQGTDASGNQALSVAAANLSGPTTLSLPATTVLKNSLPANAATGVSKRPTLSWTPVAGANLYYVLLTGPGVSFTFVVPTSAGASLEVPDYSAFGIGLAGSSVYNWTVVSVKSTVFSSPDDLPSNPILSLYVPFLTGTPADLFISKSTSFTTVP